ncbi:Aste57867_23305 [Aphanomyces stellatus]|uniref:Aste57867_23305 protein n=1 Tax=Aphanomyces stellatus TaxID=120398 RepID=A0A485LMS8_9STRA|nr:hypothetical protein As57867_023234 [Aphanomyces stellatus]VFT99950.1 Aste57867_23305 [Aphanomyces stellatus]
MGVVATPPPRKRLERNISTETWIDSSVNVSTVAPVSVSTAAMSVQQKGIKVFTLYTFVVNVPATNTWWVLRKRFSHFYAFRNELLALAKFTRSPTASLQSIHDALVPVVATPFPRRRFVTDTDKIKAERSAALASFTSQLVALRLECIAMTKSMTDHGRPAFRLKYLRKRLDVFLQVPHFNTLVEGADEVEAAMQDILKDAAPMLSSECAICLEDGDDKVLHLHCGHGFHKDCLLSWILIRPSCPLCRKVSTYGVIRPAYS